MGLMGAADELNCPHAHQLASCNGVCVVFLRRTLLHNKNAHMQQKSSLQNAFASPAPSSHAGVYNLKNVRACCCSAEFSGLKSLEGCCKISKSGRDARTDGKVKHGEIQLRCRVCKQRHIAKSPTREFFIAAQL